MVRSTGRGPPLQHTPVLALLLLLYGAALSWASLRLDTNSRASMPSTVALGIKQEFTVQFWFLLGAAVPAEVPQMLMDARDPEGNGWYIQKDATDSLTFMGRCTFDAPARDEWHHLGVIATPTATQVLLDGRVQCTAGSPIASYSSLSSAILLGSSQFENELAANLVGALAEIRVHNQALLPDDITAERGTRLCDPLARPSLVAYYPLARDVNEASGLQMPVVAINAAFGPDPQLIDPVALCDIVCAPPLVKDAYVFLSVRLTHLKTASRELTRRR